AVAVGAENDLIADPVRVEVVAAIFRLRNLFNLVVGPVKDPDAGVGAAAVVLPPGTGVAVRAIGDLGAVGRNLGFPRVGDRQLRRHAAGGGDGKQLAVAGGINFAVRTEQHLFAVGRPAADDVGTRVPGQPLRHAAGDRYCVNVGVPVVLGAEGD